MMRCVDKSMLTFTFTEEANLPAMTSILRNYQNAFIKADKKS